MLHWQSSTAFQPVSLTSVFANSFHEHMGWHSHHRALVFPRCWCPCLDVHRISHLAHSCLHSWLHYPNHQSSEVNVWCRRHFQRRYNENIKMDDGWFFWLGGHSNFTSSCREVLCRKSWWQRWSFWECKCRRTLEWKVWVGCVDDLFGIWNVSYSSYLLLLCIRFLQCST